MPHSSNPLMHPVNYDLPTLFRALTAGRLENEQSFLRWLADYIEQKGIPRGLSMHSFEMDMENADPADLWKMGGTDPEDE